MPKNRIIKIFLKYDFSYDLFLHEKGKFIFPFSYLYDPDPGSGSGIKDGSGIPNNGQIWIRDKHPGSATMAAPPLTLTAYPKMTLT
jgi:hypothetical protein